MKRVIKSLQVIVYLVILPYAVFSLVKHKLGKSKAVKLLKAKE